MRPPKAILLYCADEQERSVLSFVLRTHNYNVLGGISKYPPLPDAVLVVDDRTLATARMACEIFGNHSDVPLIVKMHPCRKELPLDYPAPCYFLPAAFRIEHMLRHLRISVTYRRKPGPKPAIVLPQVA